MGNDQFLPPPVSWPDLRLLPDFASMIEPSNAVGRPSADGETGTCARAVVLTHPRLHRKTPARHMGLVGLCGRRGTRCGRSRIGDPRTPGRSRGAAYCVALIGRRDEAAAGAPLSG